MESNSSIESYVPSGQFLWWLYLKLLVYLNWSHKGICV